MKRRDFLAATGGMLAMPLARAQRPAGVPMLGLLIPNPSLNSVDAFFAPQLKALGWVVGTNLRLEMASADGREDRLPELVKQLIAKGVDVIWSAGPEATLAAARATDRIPIAFYGVGYPVEHGFADSLRRPGRNVTGFTALAGSERAKQLELLREAAPAATRLGWVQVETVVPTLSGGTLQISREEVTSAAGKLGFQLQRHGVARREDLDTAFANILSSRAQALIADFTAMTWRERQRIAEFALRHRLPSVSGTSDFAEAGCLLSYGANRIGQMVRSLSFVDRILRGARAGEIPIELPTQFELTVNAKTAQAIGVSLPMSLLARADRVIE